MIEDLPELGLVAILERTIADQLRINSTISGQIDVLEKDTPQRRRDFVPGLVHLYVNRGGANWQAGREENQRKDDSTDARFHVGFLS